MSNDENVIHGGRDVHQLQKSELVAGVVGLFDAPLAANQAFESLLDLGHRPDEIGIMISEETKQRFLLPSALTHPVEREHGPELSKQDAEHVEEIEKRAVLKGAGAVSAVGALGGAILATTAAVVVPGLGLLLLGPLAGLGAAFGAYVGGVYAVPAIEAAVDTQMARYETEVRAGKVLIHVLPRSPEEELRIRSEWTRIGGEVV